MSASRVKFPKIFRSSFDAKLWLKEEFKPSASVLSWNEREKVANVKTLLESKVLKEYTLRLRVMNITLGLNLLNGFSRIIEMRISILK